MAMTPEQLDTLVQRLEKYARQEPANYRLRVGLLAALGYAYIFLIFVLLVGMLWTVRQAVISIQAGELVTQLNVITVVLVLSLFRLFWVSFPPPKGIALNRQQVPQLFIMIDELTAALEAPQFHHIILNNQLNAGVLQIPRFGFLGWQRNYLLLGLPLMQALSPAQFRAVVAHELGHLSGNHSRFSGWIYRVRNTWFQLVERYQTDGQGSSLLFGKFFKWYAPFFKAYSFVLARINEYEADRCAAQLAGVHNAAQALVNLEINSYFLGKSFWPRVYQQAVHQLEPPEATVTTLLRELQTGINSEDASIWLDQALAAKTNNEDTHPCLADRLSAFSYLPVGYQLPLPVPSSETAAQHFLGEGWESFSAELDRQWKQEVTNLWKEQHIKAQQQTRNLEALEAKAQTHFLTVEEAWKRAFLTAEFKGKIAALPLFQEVLTQEPLHPAANYGLGELLVSVNDVAGIDHIETAMARDPDLVIPGCELVYKFLKQLRRVNEAQLYQRKAQEHYNAWKLSREERSTVGYRDLFAPHNLPDAEIKQIATQLSDYPFIKEAYLVQKIVTHFPEKPFYVLGITRRFVRDEALVYRQDHELMAQLMNELNFSGEVSVIILNQYNLKLGKVLRKIKGAFIDHA